MFAILSIIVRLAGTTTSSRLSRRLNAGCERVAGFFFRRSAIASLNALDDRALRDIGLERSQIEAAVRGFVTLLNRGRP